MGTSALSKFPTLFINVVSVIFSIVGRDTPARKGPRVDKIS